MDKEELLSKLAKAVNDGDEEAASEIAQKIVAAGIDAMEALNWATKGTELLGEKYERLEAFLPDLILSGDAMKACTDILMPQIGAEQKDKALPRKVVIGTVSGDVHDLGKNLVAGMLSVHGFAVYDLGKDVPSKIFINKAEEVGAKVIALSSLMSTSIYFQEEIIRYLADAGLRQKYYVVVGGGPITPQWTTKIGADGHARLAVDASLLLERLLSDGVPPPPSQPIITGY